MAYSIQNIQENQELQNQVTQRLNQGKKVIFKFDNEQDKLDFIKQAKKLLTRIGGFAGAGIGLTVGSMFGIFGAAVGAGIGTMVGAAISCSLGAWLANFLWHNVINRNKINYREAFSWFGLAPNRMIVRAK